MTLIVAATSDDGQQLVVVADSRIDWHIPGVDPTSIGNQLGMPKLYYVSDSVMVGISGQRAHLSVDLVRVLRADPALRTPTEFANHLATEAADSEQFLVMTCEPSIEVVTVKKGQVASGSSFGWVGDRDAYSEFQAARALAVDAAADFELTLLMPMSHVIGLDRTSTVGELLTYGYGNEGEALRLKGLPTMIPGDAIVGTLFRNGLGHTSVGFKPEVEGGDFSHITLPAVSAGVNGTGVHFINHEIGVYYDINEPGFPRQFVGLTTAEFVAAVHEEYDVKLMDPPEVSHTSFAAIAVTHGDDLSIASVNASSPTHPT